MDRKTLCALGLNTTCGIPAHTLFSPEFDPEQFGLRNEDKKTIGVLRDFVAQYNREIPLDERKALSSPDDGAKTMYPVFRDLDHEEVWAIFLSKANLPITKKMICSGSLDQSVIDRRKIVKQALDLNAVGVILSHNHPSGNPRPSSADIKETDGLRAALGFFDIKLIDHIIIAASGYYSFADETVTQFHK